MSGQYENPGHASRRLQEDIALVDELDRLRSENAKLRAALEPFAFGCILGDGTKESPDPNCCRYCAAREALAGSAGTEEGK